MLFVEPTEELIEARFYLRCQFRVALSEFLQVILGSGSIAKQMRTMAGVYYGRVIAYREAFAAADQAQAVAAVLARNLHPAEPAAAPELGRLAGHAIAFKAALAATPIEALANGNVPEIAAVQEAGAAP